MCFVLDLNFFPNNIRFFSATSGCGGMGAKFSYLDFRMAASSPKDAPIHNPCPPFAVIVEKHVEDYGTQVLSNIVNGKLQSIPNSLIRASVWLPLRHIASKRNTYSPGERSDIFRCSRNQIFRFDGKLFFFGAISNHHVWLAELSIN